MLKLNLDLKRSSQCEISIDYGLLNKVPSDLRKRPLSDKYVIITDSNVERLPYIKTFLEKMNQKDLNTTILSIRPGEKFKVWRTIEKFFEELIEKRINRNSAIIALGGGVVGDIVGFVASIYMRGIPLIQIPTTLLSQVDSSIGGKTGVDLIQGKNLLGTFYQPQKVYIDPFLLKYLDKREIRSGLAEVIKYGIVYDKNLFEYLEKSIDKTLKMDEKVLLEIVKRSVKIKLEIVRKDEREENLRSILNYGHTLGHAVEVLTGYKKFTHGEAIAIGMACAGRIAVEKGFWDEEDLDRQVELLKRVGLPIKIPSYINSIKIIEAMRSDKKVESGVIHFILPNSIGKMATVNGKYRIPIPENELRNFLLKK